MAHVKKEKKMANNTRRKKTNKQTKRRKKKQRKEEQKRKRKKTEGAVFLAVAFGGCVSPRPIFCGGGPLLRLLDVLPARAPVPRPSWVGVRRRLVVGGPTMVARPEHDPALSATVAKLTQAREITLRVPVLG